LAPSGGAAGGPNAKEPQGAGHFAGGPLPPSGRAAGLAAYKRPAAQPPALIPHLSNPVKKKKERGGEREEGAKPCRISDILCSGNIRKILYVIIELNSVYF
jgi:hypothetical protein